MQSAVDKLWQAMELMLDNFLARLPALVLAIAVFIAIYAFSRFAAQGIQKAISARRSNRSSNLAILSARLTRGVTILFGLMVGVSIVAPSFQASDLIKTLGIGGVAIGFAFQNILQNFLAGILLLWSEPFRVGDEIKIDAYEGTVEEIQARATIVNTYDKRQVIIPNADLFTRAVIVNTASGSRRWQYDLDVKKRSVLQDLKRSIAQAVRRVPGVLSNPEPEALVVEVAPETVKLRIFWSTTDSREHQMLGSYDQVLTAVAEALNEDAERVEQRVAA